MALGRKTSPRDVLSAPEPLPVAILAGGMATRLGELTKRVPKSLLEIAGRPFLAWQLDLLHANGIRHVVLCVGHLGEMIRRRFGDGRQYGLSIEYSLDGPVLLGTGGALRNALPLLGRAFFVLYGDSYLPVDMPAVQSAFEVSGKSALMTVYANRGKYDRSNVRFQRGRILAYDKVAPSRDMRHIDYGLSALNASALEAFESRQCFDLAQIFTGLVHKGELAGYLVRERFYEIGSPGGIEEFRRLVTAHR
ncbi:MAG: nucleotidyltransferase family protein [Verrucomicrobiae bacterium]|nr:nucleotidyltransferase family protein [Verrucomicrobiae bacterium]